MLLMSQQIMVLKLLAFFGTNYTVLPNCTTHANVLYIMGDDSCNWQGLIIQNDSKSVVQK